MLLWGSEPDVVEMWWQAWLCVTTGMCKYDNVGTVKTKGFEIIDSS